MHFDFLSKRVVREIASKRSARGRSLWSRLASLANASPKRPSFTLTRKSSNVDRRVEEYGYGRG